MSTRQFSYRLKEKPTKFNTTIKIIEKKTNKNKKFKKIHQTHQHTIT